MTLKSSTCSMLSISEEECTSITPFLVAFLFLVLIASGCTSSESSDPPNTDTGTQPALTELFFHYETGNYFKLRDGLQRNLDNDDPQTRFLLAVMHHAFNEPAESNRIIEQILPQMPSLADTLTSELYSLKLENYLRLHQYPKALEAASAIIERPKTKRDSTDAADAENIYQLLEALADTPPQEVASQSATSLQMNRDKAGLQRIPVSIGESQRRYVLDTGANYSVLMRSEALNLGLEIKEAGVKVNSSTGGKVPSDVAVASEVTLGGVVYHNVMFLVFPDEALSFPQIDYNIPGIIGFPLIEAVGEIRFQQGDTLEIPAEPSSHTEHNLALEGLDPRVQVNLRLPPSPSTDSLLIDSLVCALDTGAPQTSLLAPFYQSNRSWVEQFGRRDTIQVGGAGGSKNMPVYWLQDVQLQIGNKIAALKEVAVHTENISLENNEGPACNMGQDVLGQFDETVINFRSMSFLLR